MASRRLFLGSVAAAGAGAIGVTAINFPVAAQPAADPSRIILELRRQLKEGFEKMRMGRSVGARQAATILRVYASTVDDGLLRATLAKANRQQLLSTEMNHEEVARLAKELGLNPATLPPHSIDRGGRETALDQLIKEGLSPSMLRVADYVDGVAVKMEKLERDGRARPLQVALRRQDPVDCGDCTAIETAIGNSEQWMEVICAAAFLFPYLMELCAAASAAYLTFIAAYGVCLEIVAICHAIYG